MHSKEWQAVCGFVTDVCETLDASPRTMRSLFDLITEEKNAPVYSWKENGRALYLRREDLRRRAVAAAKKLVSCVPQEQRMVGLHVSDPGYWPVWYWAILMSGHVPLLLDSERELFSYRTLKGGMGTWCITRDRNYGWVIDPESLKSGSSQVDAAYFDDMWADETVFVTQGRDGRLSAAGFSGAAVCAQVLRLSRVYRQNGELLAPPQMGRMRLLLQERPHEFFGWLCGAVLYPLFSGEVFLYPYGAAEGNGPLFAKDVPATHLCLSAEGCAQVRDRALRAAEAAFPKAYKRYAAYLDGEERVNDYRVLARYGSMSDKLRRRLFGKKARCVLCAGEEPDTRDAGFFERFGLSFSAGLCCGHLGLVAMELSPQGGAGAKGSVGQLLEGVRGLSEGGRMLLSCSGEKGKILENGALREAEDPYPLPVKAYFNAQGRLCLEEDGPKAAQRDAAADPLTVRRLRETYAQVLGLAPESIGENMDFFSDLGGDSLTYFLLLQHIEAGFGVSIPADERTFFVTVRFAAETLAMKERKVETNDA